MPTDAAIILRIGDKLSRLTILWIAYRQPEEDGLKLVRTEAAVCSGTLALMLDSVRNRLFNHQPTAPPRVALSNDVVPHQVAFCTSSDQDCQDFVTYLTQLLTREGIRVWPLEVGDFFFNEYEACDGHGVPYLVRTVQQTYVCEKSLNST